MAVYQSLNLGDSLSQATEGHSFRIDGGQGGWPELLVEGLANLPMPGPKVSSGVRGVWLGLTSASSTTGEVTYDNAGLWNTIATSDPFDKCQKARYGNGISRVLSFSATGNGGRTLRIPVGFTIWYVDMTGSGDFQYRVNGGAYVNSGQTFVQDNAVKKFYVAFPGALAVDIRCYNGSTGVNTLPIGIEWYHQAPNAASGYIHHDLGCDGQLLHELLSSTAGDKFALINAILSSTVPVSSITNLFVSTMWTRDVTLANTTTWDTDLGLLYARIHPYTNTLFFNNPHEMKAPTYPTADSTAYRAQTKTTAAALGVPIGIDLYDQWSALGFTGYQPTYDQGFVLPSASDNGHYAQAGHLDIWWRIYWRIRKLLGIGAVPSVLPVRAKTAAVAYTGKQAAVAYTSGAPISI